jgi:two-component system LytT family response regulator
MLPLLLKSIIVDDERPSREGLINYIEEFCPDVEIIAECNSAKSAFKAINEHKPHLVFLDIEMPRGSGIDLLKMFESISFKVIFITAFSDYAVQAFRYSATDFLLKPVKVSELVEAVKRAKFEIFAHNSFENIEFLLQNFNSPSLNTRKLVIPNSQGFCVVNTSEIIMCKADGYCTHFFLENDKKITSSYNLRFYEDLLPSNQFMRVHNSFIINTQHVLAYNNHGFIELTENNKCSLSAARKSHFLHVFRNL